MVGKEVENNFGLIVYVHQGVFEGKRAGVDDRVGEESGASTEIVEEKMGVVERKVS